MTSPPGKARAGYLKLAGLQALSAHRVRRILAVILAVCPPVVCAWLAEDTGGWELFERSGSITTAIGLMLASGRYVQHSVDELAMLHVKGQLTSELAELREDISSGKFGLALSAFGTVVWGWGTYLGWWSFSCLVVWAVLALRDARRDAIVNA